MNWVQKLVVQKEAEQQKIFKQRLSAARAKVRYSQSQVARLLGLTQDVISKMESGTRQVTFIELEQLAAIYQQRLTFFETLEEVERLNPNLVVPPQVRFGRKEVLKNRKKLRRSSKT